MFSIYASLPQDEHHNSKIGGYAFSMNRNSEIPNKILVNITGAILMNTSHKKELCCLTFQYAIWVSKLNENRLCGDVTYFL